jgi:light-regulated signal transduction histidine kinase (bacteriophytochrome)
VRVAAEWPRPQDAPQRGIEAGEVVCQLLVQDNGIGFDEKYLDRVFAVFQRLHGRNEYEGTGIGLAICRKIAERHRGSITARSTPGQGSTFIVTLPVRQTREKIAA